MGMGMGTAKNTHGLPMQNTSLGLEAGVAMRTFREHILNKVFSNLEGRLKLNEAVSDDFVASLRLKHILNKYVKVQDGKV